MTYTLEKMRKNMESFKMNTLLRLQALEMKVDTKDQDWKEIKQEIKEVEKMLIGEMKQLDESFESFKTETPRKTTNKIVFTIFGATLSFLFASILRIFENIMF